MHLDIHRRSLPASAGSASNMIIEVNSDRKADGLSGSSIHVWVNGLLVGNLNDDEILTRGRVAGANMPGYGLIGEGIGADVDTLVDTNSTWYTQMVNSSTSVVTQLSFDDNENVSIDQDFVDDYNTSNGTNITLDNLLFDTSFTDLKQAVIDEGGFIWNETLQFEETGTNTGDRLKIILFFEDIILLQSEP